MQSTSDVLQDMAAESAARRVTPGIWVAAAALAALATWVLYLARPGINWPLCACAGAALLAFMEWRARGTLVAREYVNIALACALAGAAAVTADPWLAGLIGLATVWVLAASLLERAGAARPGRLLVAPFPAVAIALSAAEAQATRALEASRGGRYAAHLRGVAWALPVVAVFFWLLSGADPVFEAARIAILGALKDLSALPRVVFFAVVAVGLLGSFTVAALRPAEDGERAEERRSSHRSDVERLIVLGAVALLFAVFLGLQLSYLFSDLAAVVGSGVTYANAARRGCSELSLAATLSLVLIAGLERSALRGGREVQVRIAAWILIGECALLLLSAWQRLAAYEEAYGYTIGRVYAHLYFLLVAAGLACTANAVRTEVRAKRLAMEACASALVLLVVVGYWNVPAWVVRRNIDRYALGQVTDFSYLGCRLGVDALPEIERQLPRLRAVDQRQLVSHVRECSGTAQPVGEQPDRWFEWNLRRNAAAAAFAHLTAAPPPPRGARP
jgi:hypothetical protein